MKFTCTSWSWSLLPFEDVVRVMSILGFRAIDVGGFTGWAHYDANDLAAQPEGMAKTLKDISQRHNVQLTDLILTFGGDLNEHCVNDPDQKVRAKNVETFKRLGDFCNQAGIPGMTLLPGVEHPAVGRSGSFDLSVQGLMPLAAAGRDAGLRVSFEPHLESISESPEDALKLVQQVEHLTFTLDYSHFVAQGYTDDQIEPLLEHAGHFHVRQSKKGENQCRTHEGSIDFDRALSRLQALGYQGWVAFEYVWEQWMDNDRVDVLCETLKLREQLAKFEDGV